MRALINMSNAATDDARVKWIDLELTERNRGTVREEREGENHKRKQINDKYINDELMATLRIMSGLQLNKFSL